MWANIRKEPNGTVGNFYSKLKKKKGSAKASSKAKMLRIIYWAVSYTHLTLPTIYSV